MEKKSNKGLIVFIIILILCIIGLVFYILVDKDIIKLNSTTVENEQVENNKTNDDKNDENNVEVVIDSENASIKNLFDNAHYLTISGIDTHIYRDGGYKVSEMSTEDKMLLLAKQWSPLVEQYSEGTSPNLTTTYYINENTLKNLFEKTFGPNTYSQATQITDGCLTLTYDANNKRYSYTGTAGCGGTRAFEVYEIIISATKYNDRIEIVSAAFYLDQNNIYKDYNKTTTLGSNPAPINTTTSQEARENTFNQYIQDNRDNLEQYTYTYTLNEDGFYYLTSVERTKA